MKFGNPQTAIVEVITCTNTGRNILFFEMPQQYIGKVNSRERLLQKFFYIIFLILVWTKQKCPYIISLTNRKSSVAASVNWGITDVSFASKRWTFGTISLFRLYDRSKVSNYDN